MTNYYLNQNAATDGSGTVGDPFNSPLSAESAANAPGDVVYVTPTVEDGSAKLWDIEGCDPNKGIIVAAGVEWRVDPAHAAPTVANRDILPYFARTFGGGCIFSLEGDNAKLTGFRVGYGLQTDFGGKGKPKSQPIVIKGNNGEVSGCVYWPGLDGYEWSDDPYQMFAKAYDLMRLGCQTKIISIQGDNCLVTGCGSRMSGWQDLQTSDDDDCLELTVRFCNFSSSHKSCFALPAGTKWGAATPARGYLFEFNSLTAGQEEDSIQLFGRGEGEAGSPEPDALARTHGVVCQYNLLIGSTGENGWDPKNGQKTLLQGNVIYGHPGCDDGPFSGQGAGPDGECFWIGFPAITSKGKYRDRFSIIRNNVIAANAVGAFVSGRAFYHNVVCSNNYQGFDGTWHSRNKGSEHIGVSMDSVGFGGMSVTNNIVMQHTKSDFPGVADSFEMRCNANTSSNRIDGNAYANNQTGTGARFTGSTSAKAKTVNFQKWKETVVNQLHGADAHSIEITEHLPIFVNFGGSNHLVGTNSQMNNFDGYDYSLLPDAPDELKTGGRGAAYALSKSSGTSISAKYPWAFFANDAFGNPGSTRGTPIANDKIMNLRTGEQRRIVSLGTDFSSSAMENSPIVVDSDMDVQKGDEFAYIPDTWTESFVPMGLIDWSGAGVDAALGQGGKFLGYGQEPVPPTPPEVEEGTITTESGVVRMPVDELETEVVLDTPIPLDSGYWVHLHSAVGRDPTGDENELELSLARFGKWVLSETHALGFTVNRTVANGATTLAYNVLHAKPGTVTPRLERLISYEEIKGKGEQIESRQRTTSSLLKVNGDQ